MKTKLFFAVCLIMMAAVVASCGKNESKNNEKPIIASVPSQQDIERDSLMLISELWETIARDEKMDFSQDTTHVLIEKRPYRIDAYQNDIVNLMVLLENKNDGHMVSIMHNSGPRRSELEGCSLVYKGKHNEFNHYVLVVDQKIYAEAQAKAKAERKVLEIHYSDGTIEKF